MGSPKNIRIPKKQQQAPVVLPVIDPSTQNSMILPNQNTTLAHKTAPAAQAQAATRGGKNTPTAPIRKQGPIAARQQAIRGKSGRRR